MRLKPLSSDIVLGTAAEALELYSAVASTPAAPSASTSDGGGALDVWWRWPCCGLRCAEGQSTDALPGVQSAEVVKLQR